MSVLAYVSGHGFGHWTRCEALLSRLSSEVSVHVCTSGPAMTLARKATWAASLQVADVGPGVSQPDPLVVDVPATRRALTAHLDAWDDVVQRGVEVGRALGARLVFADVPPVAFAIAKALGVPSVGMANFTWSWAYEHYASEDPTFRESAERLRAAEGLATRFISLPGGGGLDAFGPPRPALALRRKPTCDVAEARRRLEALCGDRRPIVLLSFGGYGDLLDLSEGARANPDWSFLSFASPRGEAPANLTVLPHDHAFPHQDLVLGADALLAKPGYGTVSECLNGLTPMAYVVPSGAFREHDRLVEMIERWLPSAPLSTEDLAAGRWGDALTRARAAVAPDPPPPDGLESALAVVRDVLNPE